MKRVEELEEGRLLWTIWDRLWIGGEKCYRRVRVVEESTYKVMQLFHERLILL